MRWKPNSRSAGAPQDEKGVDKPGSNLYDGNKRSGKEEAGERNNNAYFVALVGGAPPLIFSTHTNATK